MLREGSCSYRCRECYRKSKRLNGQYEHRSPRLHRINNLIVFVSADLGFPVVFNEKNTCVLRIDGEFSMHMTFLTDKKQLFVYAPLLEGFPQSDLVLLEIYDKLMQG